MSKMRIYLAIMEPKNPYTFSTDQKSKYSEVKESPTGKESYYVESYSFPEQTSIWGMLRFLILEQGNMVHSNFIYTDAESEKIKQMIGSDSFRFSSETEQDFGRLKWISPVFLCEYTDKNNVQYIVRNPMCNEGNADFVGLSMEKVVGVTDFGSISLPTNYDAKDKDKKRSSGVYVNISANKRYSEDDIFKRIEQAGNRKNEGGKLKQKDDGAFFRRVRYMLKKGENGSRGFAFFVGVEDIELSDDIVTIGAGKNVFSIKFIEKEKADIDSQLQKWGSKCKDTWGYALSDIVVKEVPKYSDFAMVAMRSMRNIETKKVSEKHNYHERFARSSERTLLIQRGSVFYNNCFELSEKPNLMKLGYNKIVKIGGGK